MAEIASNTGWSKGYVYLGGQLLAVQYSGVYWAHQDPITKSQRFTNGRGTIVSTVDLDPWGAETTASKSGLWQPQEYTSYTRDTNLSDDAMFRRYNRYHARFDQPDPYDGSYDQTDPQTFNRYAYVDNDPVNFADHLGLDPKCHFPDFNQLNSTQQRLLGVGGYWRILSDRQKAVFLNVTADLDSEGITLNNLEVQDIDKEDILLRPGLGGSFSDFQKQLEAHLLPGRIRGHYFTDSSPEHGGRNQFAVRENVSDLSLHMGYGPDGSFTHVDPHGWKVGIDGTLGHAWDYILHKLTGTGTNPFDIGKGLRALGVKVGYHCSESRDNPGGRTAGSETSPYNPNLFPLLGILAGDDEETEDSQL